MLQAAIQSLARQGTRTSQGAGGESKAHRRRNACRFTLEEVAGSSNTYTFRSWNYCMLFSHDITTGHPSIKILYTCLKKVPVQACELEFDFLVPVEAAGTRQSREYFRWGLMVGWPIAGGLSSLTRPKLWLVFRWVAAESSQDLRREKGSQFNSNSNLPHHCKHSRPFAILSDHHSQVCAPFLSAV